MMNDTKVQTPFLTPDGAPSLADLLASTAPPLPPQAPMPAPTEILREAAPTTVRTAVQEHAGFCVDASIAQDAAPMRAPLLLVCMARSEGALIQAWLARVLAGALPRCVAFEDKVIERVLRQEPQAVLIQFDADCLDAAVALSEQLQRSAPHIPRVAVGVGQQPASMRAALRSGAQDFLDVNDSLETAQQALSVLLNRRAVAPADTSLSPVTALVSARAGMGCSVLAAHLAWYLQLQLARAQLARPAADAVALESSSLRAATMSGDDERALEALLIEVSQPGGDCAIYLNTPGEFRFADALHQRQRLDRRMAQIALARHASGLRMLTQTHASLAGKDAQSAQDEQAMNGQCADLLQRLRAYFRHLLLDMGACDAQRPQSIDMLLAAGDIWVVCDQSVASVVWTMELLQQFDACSIPRDRMRLIVGRHDARIDLTAEQLAQQLRLPLLAVIPERRRELAQQLNQGELLHPRQTREPFVQAVSRLASGLLAAHHPELVQDPASPASAWARLLARMTRH